MAKKTQRTTQSFFTQGWIAAKKDRRNKPPKHCTSFQAECWSDGHKAFFQVPLDKRELRVYESKFPNGGCY